MSARPRVLIRAPRAEDAAAFLAAVRASRALHGRWVRAPADAAQYADFLARMAAAQHRAFLVCRADDDALVGVIAITNMVMGVFRSGYLSYYAFSPQAGRGLMKQGLTQVIRHAFGEMKLHRLEANIQPENAASLALARTCGLSREGYSPRYLKIGGRWRDHERWAILAR